MLGRIKSIGKLKLFHIYCGLTAFVMALMGQVLLSTNQVVPGVVFYSIAIISLLLGFYKQQGPQVLLSPFQPANRGKWTLWGYICGGVALALAGLSFWLFTTDLLEIIPWILHVVSIILFVLGIFWLDGFRNSSGQYTSSPENRWNWLEIGILLVIFAIAIFMRLYRFDQIPFGTWYDEADYGLNALKIISEPASLPTYVESTQLPAHFIILIAIAIKILGTSTLSIRTVSVLFGLGTVAAAYLAGRELFNRKMGLILAFFLAIARWDINWSRIGMHGVTVPFFELLTIGLLLRALRRQRLVDYALAGLSMGLGLCFYFSFRLFPLVIVLFLIILWLTRSDLLRSSWRGLVVFSLAVIIITVPVSQLAISNPDALWARMQTTSIFSGKTLSEGWMAVAQTTKEHLLMFNYQGDRNGRHNLVGAPMLDIISGAFLILGVALSLRRIRQPVSFLLIIWLLLMLVPGIFSLDFESPQSYRSIGSLPAAFLLATIPLQALCHAWEQNSENRKMHFFYVSLVLVLLLAGYLNYHTYFDLQANSAESWDSFSTPETLVGKTMNELGSGVNYYVSVFYYQSPTVRFVAPNIENYQKLQSHQGVPLNLAANKDAVFFIDPNREPAYLELKNDFPAATYKEVDDPDGKAVLYEVILKPEDIQKVQGLTASYYSNLDWSGNPVLIRQEAGVLGDWKDGSPLPLPFSVEWKGILYAPDFGNYQLTANFPDKVELYLDEVKLDLSGEGKLTTKILLAKGTHTLRIRALGKTGHFEFDWKPPSTPETPVPATLLLLPPITNNGLLGRYYPNENWDGVPANIEIDPWIHFYFQEIPLPRPYTVEWTGQINITKVGHYKFGLESIDQSSLFIDGKQVVDDQTNNQYQAGDVDLTTGLHSIRLRFADLTGSSHINLYWTPPNGELEPVPQQVLFPPVGNPELLKPIEGLDVKQTPVSQSQTADVVQMVPLNPTILPVSTSALTEINVKPLWQTGTCGPAAGQFSDPHGINLDQHGHIWVADTGNHRVVELDSEGKFVNSFGQVGDGDGQFYGPFDLVVEADNNLVVLDSESPKPLKRFSPDGTFKLSFGVTLGAYNPRGLSLGPSGSFYMADTGTGRLLRVSSEGILMQQWKIDIQGDNSRQPVSVTAGPDGTIYLTDALSGMLLELPVSGDSIGWQAVSPSDTMSGSHLAIGPKNTLYLTDPEKKRIVIYKPDGQLVGQIHLSLDQTDPASKPIGIAASKDGKLIVSDLGLCQVSAFALPDALMK